MAQNRAAWAELNAQTRAVEVATSRHLGEVGKKVQVRVSITFVRGYHGAYGMTYFHVLKDEKGNILVYKGSKKLGEKLDTIDLEAKVKDHGEREGVQQTVVQRPKVQLVIKKSLFTPIDPEDKRRRFALIEEMLALPDGSEAREVLWERLERGDY